MVDKNQLWGNSWIYDTPINKWVHLNDVSLFKKLGLNFKLNAIENACPKRAPIQCQNTKEPQENIQKMEAFFLDDYVSIFQNQIEKLLDNNLKLVDENMKFKVDKSETKAEYEMLKFQTNLQLQKVENANRSLQSQVHDQNELIEIQRKELREVKSNYQSQVDEQYAKLNNLFETQQDLSSKVQELTQNVGNKEKLVMELEDHINKLQREKRESLSEAHEQYEKELGSLRSKISTIAADHEAEIIKIKASHEQELEKQASEFRQQIEELQLDSQEKIKNLQMEIDVREHQLKNSSVQTSSLEGKDIDEIVNQKDKKIKELLNKQNLIKNKYKEDVQKAHADFAKYKQFINLQKEKERTLNSNMSELTNRLSQAQNDLEHERLKSQRLEQLMEQQSHLDEIAVEKAKVQDEFVAFKELGKLFEISNAAQWEIRNDNFSGEILTLKEVRDLLEQEKITPETFVKREGKWWKKAKEIHELFLQLREKEENGEIHYYIERQSLRVPCGDKVEVLTKAAELEGVCVNISTGGCLIQMQYMNKQVFKDGDEITIQFKSESLLFEFEIIGTIRSIDEADSSLGIQFVGISDEEFDTITFYIDSFVDKVEEEAA